MTFAALMMEALKAAAVAFATAMGTALAEKVRAATVEVGRDTELE